MSEQLTGALFDSEVFSHPSWWIGRVESKESWNDNIKGETFTNSAEIKGWGHRYKVRVFNWHTGDLNKVQPVQIPYMQVVMPVTAGSGHGGASITPSIEAGSVVFGFFMDGMAGQEGYIIGVLGNSNNNVPTQRGAAAPNQPQTRINPTTPATPTATPTAAPATPTTTTTQPPTPPTGPGSLANQPVPPNVDQLSIEQLKKLLDPSKTPSSAVFRAASEARQKAKAAGLPAAEVERLVLVATVIASRQPGADAGGSGNCNLGYQQFNNTYSDGSPQTSARVPDNLIAGNAPLSTTESLHQATLATNTQDSSRRIKIPLLDVSRENNGNMKGIQRIIKNLINGIEELKKIYNQISAFASNVSEFVTQIQTEISGAVTELSSFIKNIISGVRGYILTKLSDQIKKVASFIFPTQVPRLYDAAKKGTNLISCVFNKIIASLPNIIEALLDRILDKMINTPLCAAENFVSGILSSVLNPITDGLDQVFSLINGFLGTVTGVIGQVGALIGGSGSAGSLFNALEYVSGILKFFSCDDPPSLVKYSEVAYGYPAGPGGDAVPPNSQEQPQAAETPTPTTPGAPTTTPTTPTTPGAPTTTPTTSTTPLTGTPVTGTTTPTPTPTTTQSSPTGTGGGGSSQPVNANIVNGIYDPSGTFIPLNGALIRQESGEERPGISPNQNQPLEE